MPDSVISKKKKRRGPLIVQLLIVVGLLAVVWFSFGQNVLAPRTQSGGPKQLGDLQLVSSIEGSEALAQVNRLHGIDIEMVNGYIAEYARGNERVTVWVGSAESSDTARELLTRMVDGIAEGNPSFSNLTRLSIAQGYHSHEVFQVDGAGGKHFFYISRKNDTQVIWLTVEATDALGILEQALDTF